MNEISAPFIGGEFWSDTKYQTGSTQISTQAMTFLNGGEGAMRLICDHLISQGIRRILIPAYICSTMADAFERYGMATTSYRIGADFRIDLADLLQKAIACRVLYIIDYFGYGFTGEEKAIFEQLHSQGMLIIEDDAQACFNREPGGDIHFNSLRKFVPLDGSFFYSNIDMSSGLSKFTGLPNRRLPVIRRFRQTFARLLNEGAEDFDELNPLFEESERHYYADLAVQGDLVELSAAACLDWPAIESVRKANHRRLLERLAGLEGIEIVFPQVSPTGPPLGFPIYVRDGKRNAVLDHLRDRHVYPVVHWDILPDPRLNQDPQVAAMSARIITLLLDQRFNLADMDYEAEMLRSFFD